MEKRRSAVRSRRTPLRRVLALAGGLGLAVAACVEACDAPAGFTPRGRTEADGVVVLFRTVPAAVGLGRHFDVDTVVCAEGGAPTLTHVDATMPAHRHGMNYRPTLTAKGNGRYVASGFLFHMPGLWQLHFDVARGERRARLTTELEVE